MTAQGVTGQPITGPATESETAPETAVRSAVWEETPAEGVNAGARAGVRARVHRFVQSHGWAGAVWDVAVGDRPSVWSTAPATPAEVFRYFAEGAWCAEDARWVRWAGQAYGLAVAVPFSVAAYVAAWVLQRPGRGAAALFLFVVIRLFT